MKRIYTLFMILAYSLLNVYSLHAQVDVTSTYLQNAGFDETPTIFTKEAGGKIANANTDFRVTWVSNATSQPGWRFIVTGWKETSYIVSNAVNIATANYGFTTLPNLTSYGLNNTTPPLTQKDGVTATGACLHMSSGWGDKAIISQDVNLAVGKYKLFYDVYNANTTAASTGIVTNFCGYSNGKNKVTGSLKTVPQYTWKTDSVTFTILSETENDTINIGFTNSSVSSNAGSKLYVDNIKLLYYGLDKTIICGGSAQLDSVTPNYSGKGKLHYKWTPSSGLNNDTIPNPVATVTENTTYQLEVYAIDGYSSIYSVNVIVNQLTANAGNDKTIICGGSAQLDNVTTNYSGSGKLRYKWTPSVSLNNDTIINPIANVTENTTYQIEVFTPNGCSAFDTVNVIVNPLKVNAGENKSIICGGSVQLDSISTNYTGKGQLKYKWTPNIGLNYDTILNPIATITENTNYIVEVTTPNGCTAYDSVFVEVNSLTANAGKDTSLICGGSVQLDSVTTNYTGNGQLKYKWTPNTGLDNDTIINPITTITENTTYIVEVTTPNACTAYDSVFVEVKPLIANAGKDKSIICGGSVQLDSVSTNYTGKGQLKYKWAPNIGLDNDTIANPTVTITENQTYTVEVNTPNGCLAFDSVNITVKPLETLKLKREQTLANHDFSTGVSSFTTANSNLSGHNTALPVILNGYMYSAASGSGNRGTKITNMTTATPRKDTVNYEFDWNPYQLAGETHSSGILGINPDQYGVCIVRGINDNIVFGLWYERWSLKTGSKYHTDSIFSQPLGDIHLMNLSTDTNNPVPAQIVTQTKPDLSTWSYYTNTLLPFAMLDQNFSTKYYTTKCDSINMSTDLGRTFKMSRWYRIKAVIDFMNKKLISFTIYEKENPKNLKSFIDLPFVNTGATDASRLEIAATRGRNEGTTTGNTCNYEQRFDNFEIYTLVKKNKMLMNCGDSIQFDSVKTNYPGQEKLRYKWTPSIGLDSDTIQAPTCSTTENTLYQVEINSPNGCSALDSVYVFVNSLSINAGKDKSLICGGSVQLDKITTNYTGNGKLKYKWTPNIGLDNDTISNPTVTITENQTYTVEVTTQNGCTAYDSVFIEVKPLIANAGKDKSLICGGYVRLDSVATNYTGNGQLKYKWTPNAGLDNDTIPNPTVTIIENKTYTVEVTTPNGCTAFDSVFIEVKPLQVNAGKDQFIVCGDSVQLISNSNYTGVELLKYKWEPSEGLNNDSISNPLVYSHVETDYRLTITTPNSCSAIDSVKIIPTVSKHQEIRLVGVNENKNMIVWNKINEKNIDSVYVYKETSLTDIYKKIGASPYSQMYFTDTTSNPVVVSSKYQITMKDKCGFETQSSNPHKTIHLAIVKGQGNTWNLIWEPYTGFTVATYKIYRGTSENTLFLLYEAAGSVFQYYDNNPPAGDVYYQIEVVPPTNQLYQSNSGFMKISNSVNLSTSRSNIATNNITGIENISYNLFEVYPNPAKDMVQLILNYSSPSIIKIYNSTGQVIKTFETSSSININVSDIPNNLYIIEVCTGLKYEKQKLVINR